jgi:predicted nucleic acid-binding protein
VVLATAKEALLVLWQNQGKRAEAHELLAPVYGWFTEGFDTADLQGANAMLATLGAGEQESIAIARARGGIELSNESRVAHHGRTYGVPCVRLPDILRALWMEGIVSQQEVQEIIRDLQVKDRMQFTQSTLQAIFAE